MGVAKRRLVNIEGLGWTCETPGSLWTVEYEGQHFELERRTRNPKDETPDTGWYLYGPDAFGEFMGTRFKDAARESFWVVCPK